MEDIRYIAFNNTIEEICFLAHLLIADENVENRLIIQTYIGLRVEDVQTDIDWLGKVALSFLMNMKASKLFTASDQVRGAPDEDDIPIDSERIDRYIREYYLVKREFYSIPNRRKKYLKEEIENGLLY